jgi:hypothetical protein
MLFPEMEDWKHGWVIKRGQKYFTAHYEKGARDKDRETEISEKVGQINDDRKERGTTGSSNPSCPSDWSAWYLDPSYEIPPNQAWFV